ncbi:MAG: acetyltransferase [Pseudomonadales bacterium]
MSSLRGIAVLLIIAVFTILVCIPLCTMALVALLLPGRAGKAWRRWMEVWLFLWCGFNRGLFQLFGLTKLTLDWPDIDTVSTDKWYVVICNHRSWTDIVILQSILWNRIPPIKFFTKQQLIWVPFIGIGMWALGFPYVKRVTRQQVAKNPALRHADREAVRKACQRFSEHPSTLLNFLEGTRFTAEKHGRQSSTSYRHLLNPKVGGLSYVLADMGSTFHRLLDVTIVYPDGAPNFWEFLQGRCARIDVHVETLPLPAALENVENERDLRRHLTSWLDHRWRVKDERLNGSAVNPAH